MNGICPQRKSYHEHQEKRQFITDNSEALPWLGGTNPWRGLLLCQVLNIFVFSVKPDSGGKLYFDKC